MPELPEVETIVRDLKSFDFIGRRILAAKIFWHRTVAAPSNAKFLKQIRGEQIASVSRRAKWIVISLKSGKVLCLHLRMSGRLFFTSSDKPVAIYDRFLLRLDDGRDLRFGDTRKFGRVYLLNETESFFQKYGPEPLNGHFKLDEFRKTLKSKQRMLKPLLMDQSFVAGLGNIYVDEALWEAELHPKRSSHSLKDNEIAKLFAAIKIVLERGIKNRGTSLGENITNYYSVGEQRGDNQDELKVFQRTGQACFRCDNKIMRLVVAQRSSHVCPQCQSLRKRHAVSKP